MQSGGDIFVISDTHFGHHNIIGFCNRPFSNVEEMNQTLIQNWNDTVGPNDIVIHDGDFAFGRGRLPNIEYRKQLNGTIILIKGNHDDPKDLDCFDEVHDYLDLETTRGKVAICHYPLWQPYYAKRNPKLARIEADYYLYGHVHNGHEDGKGPDNTMNICVEKIGYRPIPLQTAIDFMDSKISLSKLDSEK